MIGESYFKKMGHEVEWEESYHLRASVGVCKHCGYTFNIGITTAYEVSLEGARVSGIYGSEKMTCKELCIRGVIK